MCLLKGQQGAKLVKKAILYLAFVALAALLIYGAINRTIIKSNESYDERAFRLPNDTQATQAGEGEGFSGEKNLENTPFSAQELLTINGVVNEVNDVHMLIEITDGTTLIVENRPWEYALQKGFMVKAGDQVQITGFLEGDEFEVIEIQNLTNNSQVVLRDENGRPGWAGSNWNQN